MRVTESHSKWLRSVTTTNMADLEYGELSLRYHSRSPAFHQFYICFLFFFKILFIYSWETERERERERERQTQAEGEAGSMQGAWRETRSPVSRITPWSEGGAKPLSHLGCPCICFLIKLYLVKKKSSTKSPINIIKLIEIRIHLLVKS